MFFSMYQNCAICGNLTDDGGSVEYKHKYFKICLDCLDFLNDKEIKDMLEYKYFKRDKEGKT